MNEKILIESKTDKSKFLTLIVSLIGIILFLIAYEVSNIGDPDVAVIIYVIASFWVIGGLVWFFSIFKCRICITDKRIYGTAGFGKRVDLPLDSVSAVASGALNSIAVATSSGKISFIAMAKRNELYEVLGRLIVERQNKSRNNDDNNATSNADELKKFKDLLDSGVITQEEFDAKKKQLLGL